MTTQTAQKTTKRAPGPKDEALFMGSLSHMRQDPLKLLMRLHNDYGDVARFRLGPYTIHSVTDPELIPYVLQNNNANYVRGRMYEQFKCFMGNGLLTNDGPAWISHRRMAQPLFNRRSVNDMAGSMTGLTGRMFEHWDENSREGTHFDIVPEMMHLSLQILSKIMFSMDLGDDLERVAPAVRFSLTAMIFTGSMAQLLPAWLPIPYNFQVKRHRATLHELMDKIIQAHREDETKDDLVSLLLSGRDPVTGKGLSETEIRDELMTIFLAGHETTGTGLSWMLYMLSKHPEVQRKLEQEISEVLGGRTPTLEDLAQMPYSHMVVEESLRMHPPIWLYPREAVTDDVIGGYHIPAGSSVFLTPFVTHRHAAYWENPDAFDPERFTPDKVASRPRFAYFPFGGGQRQCIGNHMAMMQLQIVLIMIAQRYRLETVPEHLVSHAFLVSLRPIHGIQMTAHRRTLEPAVAARPAVTAKAGVCPFSHTAVS